MNNHALILLQKIKQNGLHCSVFVVLCTQEQGRENKTMKKDFIYTLKMFLEDYEGFDWETGKLIIIKGTTPHICNGFRKEYLTEKYQDKAVKNWTHDNETLVIVLE